MKFGKPQIRFVIADSHPIFRKGLRRLLEAETDFKVLGEAADGVEAVKFASELKPDILLMELHMPKQPGLDAVRALSVPANATPVRVILLTAAAEKREIVEALQLGARGVVLKGSAVQLLLKAIQTVMAGEYWVGRESVSNLVEYLRTMMESIRYEARQFDLTPRETEIVSAVVAGYSNREIAECFRISEDTVKHHLSNIYNKLGVTRRLELALFAVRSGDAQKGLRTRRWAKSVLTMKQPLWEDHDREDPLRGNLVALLLAVCTLAIYAAVGYGAFLVLRAPLHLFARFLLRLTS